MSTLACPVIPCRLHNHMLKQALLLPKPMGRYAFIAPQLKQAKEATWAYLKHFTSIIPGRQVNESELSIYLPSNGDGSKIRIFGADNPDALRGAYYVPDAFQQIACCCFNLFWQFFIENTLVMD